MNNNTPKKQYVSPEIEVVELEPQGPILVATPNGYSGSFASPFFDEEETDD